MPYLAREQVRQRRETVGVFLRETDFSLTEIANRVSLSRERVRQIQEKYFPESLRRKKGGKSWREAPATSEQRNEMERMRLLAAQDLLDGLSQADVARKYGVTRTTASRWSRQLSAKGIESLRMRRATGRPSKLTAEQFMAAAEIYQAGPASAGLDSPHWTTARFADAIFVYLGVRYDPDHVGRIIRRFGGFRVPEDEGFSPRR